MWKTISHRKSHAKAYLYLFNISEVISIELLISLRIFEEKKSIRLRTTVTVVGVNKQDLMLRLESLFEVNSLRHCVNSP